MLCPAALSRSGMGADATESALGQEGQCGFDLAAAEASVALELVQLGGERGEQHVDQSVRFGQFGRDQQGTNMGAPETVGAGNEAGAAGLAVQGEVQVAVQ